MEEKKYKKSQIIRTNKFFNLEERLFLSNILKEDRLYNLKEAKKILTDYLNKEI